MNADRMAETIESLPEVVRTMLSGAVVEDRWGLRWRADTSLTTHKPGWQCRSVGLRIFWTTDQLLARGPLKYIRTDRVFAAPAAKLARETGQKHDEAVAFDGDTAEDAAGPALNQLAEPGNDEEA